jgi:hypothetical protein
MLCGDSAVSEQLNNVRLLPRLPCRFKSYEPKTLPKELLGATIVAIGTPKNYGLVPGGGLWIDYRQSGSREICRIVLAFDEVAMWVAAHIYGGNADVPSSEGTPT